MKTTPLTLASLLALVTIPALALTVPVAQDTSSNSLGKLAGTSGKAATLTITAKQTALIRFDLSDTLVVPDAVQPGNIKSATLRLYVASVKPAGDVFVRIVTADWQERFTGAPVALPTIQAGFIATIPAAELVAKNYVHVDVTAAIIAALQNGSDFGFALQTVDTKAKVVFASKEGAASGYSAELEIVANTALDTNGALVAASGAFTGPLNVANVFLVEDRPSLTAAAHKDIFIGMNAGAANTSGENNVFLGLNAGFKNTSANQNTFLGSGAGFNTTTGGFNTSLGFNAGSGNTDGSYNTFIGANTGATNGSGFNNVMIGAGAGAANSANQNVFIGVSAGAFNTTGTRNVFVGEAAGNNNTGNDNTFVGYRAGAANVGAVQNTFFGVNAGTSAVASFNSFFGAGAGQNTSSGIDNSAFGNVAGVFNTTGKKNTFFGANTGGSNTVEDRNTFIGEAANGAAGITNSTALGQGATVTASNSVVLGNNCNVGIRTSAPNSALQVGGSLSLPVRTVNNTLLTGLGDSDCVLIVTGTLATGVLLPQPGIAGRIYIVKNRSSQTVTLSFQTAGPTIDGSTSLALGANAKAQMICDGTNWFVIN